MVNQRFSLLIVSFFLLTISVPPVFAVPEDYDHYVSFNLRVNSLAPDYAYDLVTRGDRGNGSQWVYNIYMFGMDSDGNNGRIAVYDCDEYHICPNLISPISMPLQPGKDYSIIWRYNDSTGGELIINNLPQGPPVGSGTLPVSHSSSFHVGENMVSDIGVGRGHSALNGVIWNFYHYEKDLANPVSSSPAGPKVNPVFFVEKNVIPASIKQDTEARVFITLKNAGTSPVHDIEIADDTLPEFPVVNGKTQYAITSIEPNETRIIRYTVKGTEPGKYILGKTQVLYADDSGNYHRISSGAPSVVVMASLVSPQSQNTGTLPDFQIEKFLSDVVKFFGL